MIKKGLIVLAITVLPLAGFEHPSLFLNQAEINILKTKKGQSPWSSDYGKIISAANGYLSAKTVNVMGGQLHLCGDPHVMYMGKYYEGGDLTDNKALTTYGAAVRALGLAYAFTGQAKYADKALEFVYDWCFNPATYMKSDASVVDARSAQALLFLSVSMPQAYFGLDMIWNYPGWTKTEVGFSREELQDWVANVCRYNYEVISPECKNNWQDWNHTMYAASMVLTDNQEGIWQLVNGMKPLLGCKMNDQGRLEHEYSRKEGGIKYTNYSLTAFIATAEILRHHGFDLYNYKTDGKGLRLAVDYIAPYVQNPSSFPWVSTSSSAHRDYLELAYFAWNSQAHLNALLKDGRKAPGSSPIGYASFTHGYRAFPFKVYGSAPPEMAFPPVFRPGDGASFTSRLRLSFTCPTADAEIFYTTDGSEPTKASTPYTGTIELFATTTVRARAYKTGLMGSSVAEATFVKIGTRIQDRETASLTGSSASGMLVNLQGQRICNEPSAPGIYIRYRQAQPEKVMIIR